MEYEWLNGFVLSFWHQKLFFHLQDFKDLHNITAKCRKQMYNEPLKTFACYQI